MDELEQLQAQIAELQKKADELANQKKSVVVEEMKAKIKAYGISAKDLGFFDVKVSEPKKVSTVAVKYRHGDYTWTGRGRQPKWIGEYVANGGNLDDLLVK